MTENDLYLKPEKGSPFGRSLPVQAIIGSTPPPRVFYTTSLLYRLAHTSCPLQFIVFLGKNDLHSENNHSNNLFEILKLIKNNKDEVDNTINQNVVTICVQNLLHFVLKLFCILH